MFVLVYLFVMGRKAHFSKEQFLDAALDLMAHKGPMGVTIQALAGRVGAPIGSVYHRFASRKLLLAQLWLRSVESFQAEFIKALGNNDGMAAALHVPRWVRTHYDESKILLLYRRDELVSGDWPEAIGDRASKLADELDKSLSGFVCHKCGRFRLDYSERLKFALIDAPYGAVRRYLEKNEAVPDFVDEFIKETYQAIIGDVS